MPSYNVTISGFVRGDDIDITRTVENIPSGQVVEKAWFTVKSRYTDTDAQALYQKIITSSPDVTQGHITNVGASGTAAMQFVLRAADTILMRAEAEYFYDIQIKTDEDKIYTPESGVIVALPAVTLSTS